MPTGSRLVTVKVPPHKSSCVHLPCRTFPASCVLARASLKRSFPTASCKTSVSGPRGLSSVRVRFLSRQPFSGRRSNYFPSFHLSLESQSHPERERANSAGSLQKSIPEKQGAREGHLQTTRPIGETGLASSPSWTRMLCRTLSSRASTSWTNFSECTTTRGSPLATESQIFFSHFHKCPISLVTVEQVRSVEIGEEQIVESVVVVVSPCNSLTEGTVSFDPRLLSDFYKSPVSSVS